MSEKFNDFENIENKSKKGPDNQLRILKIFAIIFILILSVAISGYLVYSYFQTNKINFNENKEKVLSENIPSKNNEDNIESNIDINQEGTSKDEEISNENKTSKLITQKNAPSVLVKPEISTTSKLTAPQNQETTKTTQTQNTTKKTQSQTNTTTETKIATSSTTTKSSSSYTIQIASFTDFDKAIALKSKLEKEGITCYIVIADIQGKYYYRVRCGKFSTKKEAEDMIKKIISMDKSLSPIILQN